MAEAGSDLVSVSEAARALGVHRSSIKRYLDEYAAELGVKGEGRARRVSLRRLKDHRGANGKTPIEASTTANDPPLVLQDHSPAQTTQDPGYSNGEALLTEEAALERKARIAKLRREVLRHEKEEREAALERGALAPVSDFEGLGAAVGARITEGLARIKPKIIAEFSAAQSEREKRLALDKHFNALLDDLSKLFEREARSVERELV